MITIGGVYIYKKAKSSKGFPVYITGGEYESGGRVSNLWKFKRIIDGIVIGSTGGDYNNEAWKFKRVKDARVTIKIGLPTKEQK